VAADSLSGTCAPAPSAPGFVMFYHGCRFGLVLTAVAELVGGLVLTVAADLLVEQLVYYEKDKRGAQPKGLLTYVTAARKYVRLP